MNQDHKRCARCKGEKPLSEFSKSQRSKDGHHSWCRQCTTVVARERRLALQKVKPRGAQRYPELYDPAWVEQKYVRELLAPEEIAALLECSISAVEAARRRYGIPPILRPLRVALRARRAQKEARA